MSHTLKTCRPGCRECAADEPRCSTCGEPMRSDRFEHCPDCRCRRAAENLNSAPVPPDVDPVTWAHSDTPGDYCDGCGLPTSTPCIVAGGGAAGGFALCLTCAEEASANV